MHLSAKVLPVAAADRDDVAYYRQRLRDTTLIDAGVVVAVDGWRQLAVPVRDEERRGGFLSVPSVLAGLAVRELLAGQTGFPDVRLSWSPSPDACHVVQWGERAPRGEDEAAHGRFYGYSPQAIARHTERLQASAAVGAAGDG